MEFRVLGTLEAVAADGRALARSAAKERLLLAALLLQANRVVPTDRLVDALWGEDPPPSAAGTLQTYVSRLRRALGDGGGDRLLTQPPGYLLRVGPEEMDTARFERLAREGRALLVTGDAGGAADRLGTALALWRGPAFGEFAAAPFARGEALRLEELRLGALEDRAVAQLALG